MKRKTVIIGFAILLVLGIVGCSDKISVKNKKEMVDTNNEVVIAEQINGIDESNDNFSETIIFLRQNGYEVKEDERIVAIEKIVSKQYQCQQIEIEYIEQQQEKHQHKADYFCINDILTGDLIKIVYVEYSDKVLGTGSDFTAFMKDVTFDGKEDLLINLGNVGTAAVYCAYINEDNSFEYEKTFSEIPSFTVNRNNNSIVGTAKSSSSTYTENVYEYVNKHFILTISKYYEYDEEVNDYILTETENY